MLKPRDFFNLLVKNDIDFVTGVPDSLLKDICAYITDKVDKKNHIIAANEGNAIALAAGHYLATGKIPLVYMQNSGIGNTVNPITSLADRHVYSIPVLLLIGWRGEPGVHDEPQHIKMGRVQNAILDVLDIPYEVLPLDINKAEKILDKAIKYMRKNHSPFALLVKKDTFKKHNLQSQHENNYPLSREQAIEILLSHTGKDDIIVSTTGKTSRELFELRQKRGETHEKDFLTVGSMGHALLIALSIAIYKSARTVWCIDGDGAAIMHMGGMTTVGQQNPNNFRHVIVNNMAYESVGKQPTSANSVDFVKIAQACGYKSSYCAENQIQLDEILSKVKMSSISAFLEIKCNLQSRKDLGRPTFSPEENKKVFMNFIK